MLNNDDPRIGTLLDRWITEEPPYEEDDDYVSFGGYEFIGYKWKARRNNDGKRYNKSGI